MTARALVLFDIDGTILRRAGPQHREALVEAVRRATGMDTRIDHIPTQGMLDHDIIRQMMTDSGADGGFVDEHMAAVMEQAQEIYELCCPDLREKVCPGVCDFLADLEKLEIPAALVTGNLTRIGWSKMENAGLRRHFRFGAFAEMGATRSELVHIALRRARQEGLVNKDTPVSLIGDHPNDIAAARSGGIRAIAVATGVVPSSELAEHTPDILVDDLRELPIEVILRPITGGARL